MGDFMIQLTYDKKDNIVYTNWILNISIDTKKSISKNGVEKVYCSYFTTLPYELYKFLKVENNEIFIIKEQDESFEAILTSKKPKPPVTCVKSKLTARSKAKNTNKTSITFTIPKKLFNNVSNKNKIKFTLIANRNDKYRNEKGLIVIKII